MSLVEKKEKINYSITGQWRREICDGNSARKNVDLKNNHKNVLYNVRGFCQTYQPG